ncbi:hypothetical protein [Roseicyclus persicicus]|uniref:Uncharacterized protein n=1 Tax=Roseicyclus persicicus TaxID=2650661 RepID=A0A7X6K0I6_9RHOB|nr:hypothetical protein [Roseibacterium persicicum]NKX46315.1 hypothetical protein [Roseibacterium persicicum]
MAAETDVRLYLDPVLTDMAERGEHLFLRRLAAVLQRHGLTPHYHVQTPAERLASASRPGRAIYLMEPPLTDRGLTIRKNYIYPFWKIERSAERWTWPVAAARFDPAAAPQPQARRFARRIRDRLFGPEADRARRDGIVYVPLQGRLLEHRSFQSMSPVEMLETILRCDTTRAVHATLHPAETYTRPERAALSALADRHPRLSLVDRPMAALLQVCDYVATQNSGVALSAYLHRKPVVLFARSDLHHIAANVLDLGAEEALARAPDLAPDVDAYLWWILHDQSINAAVPETEDRIEATLRRHGWLG